LAKFLNIPIALVVMRDGLVVASDRAAGHDPDVAGLWGAALFLVLLLTMLNTFGVSAGIRFVVTGLVIIAAGGQKAG
jgi:ribose transport system permease protein